MEIRYSERDVDRLVKALAKGKGFIMMVRKIRTDSFHGVMEIMESVPEDTELSQSPTYSKEQVIELLDIEYKLMTGVKNYGKNH